MSVNGAEDVAEERQHNNNWQDECVGRDAVRETLQNVFDEVATADKHGRHTPQFRILLGLTGVGKTRIAQELYRWLTVKRDTVSTPTGYWPDTLLSAKSDGVNPHFDLSEDRPWTEIPFLWWGLKFERGNQPGDPLHTSLKRLPAHTAAAMAKRLSSKQWLTNAKKLAGYGFDLLPVVKEIKTGYGLLKDGLEVLTGRKERLNAESDGTQTIAAQEQRERFKWSDTAIESLRQFMDDRDTAAPTVPVVLFLDDAQWIDPVTMQFVSELWKTAVAEGWPLLVVATHWADEWKAFEATQQANDSRNYYDTNVGPVPTGHPNDRDAMAGGNRPYDIASTPQNLVEFLDQLAEEPRKGVETIDVLGVEAAAMSELVRQALPHITDDQVQLLLEKARAEATNKGGQRRHRCNARMIYAMIDVLYQKKRDFFANGNPQTDPLSDAACRWVKEEVNRLDLDTVIRKLFESFEDEVQQALGWSSLQGRRFLVEVTQEVAKQLTGPEPDAATAHLRKAENPRLWVERIPQALNDASRFNLLAFRQRVFQEVAASNFTLLDEQRQAVDEAVSDVLRGWLEAGRMDPPEFQVPQNGHGLTREELRDLLIMAIHRFDPTEKPIALDADRWGQPGRHADARLCGLAAAKLARLNADDGLWEQAEVAALKFADAFPDGCSRDVVNTFLQIEIVDLLNETREHEKAFRIANGLAETIRQALADGNESKDNLRDAYIATWWAGASLAGMGNRAAALDLYRESLDICRRIVERFGESPQSLRDVGVSLNKVGDVELAEGNRAAALDLYRESLDICRRIVERFGESPQSLRDVSVSLNKVGDVELAEGNRAAALDLYRESLAIRRRIVERFGESPQSLRDVSVSLNKVGNVELAEGSRATALELYRESLDIRRRIVERFGESPESLRDVSVSLNKVGDVELAEGNRAAALDLYRESLAIRRRIVERFGESPESLSDVVISRVRMSQVEPESAREHLTEAKTIADRLAERNWLTANQRGWPQIISQRLSDLDDSGEQN